MLEDSLDPRPHPGQFARLMAERAAERAQPGRDNDDWLRSWHDREGAWTNLRNVEHWIEYSAR